MSLSARKEFNAAERVGLSFIAIGGSVSLFSIIGVLLYTAIKRSRRQCYGADVSDSNLFLTLMVADLIRSIGVLFNIIWVTQGRITEGPCCTAQAVLIQIGSVGVSLTSLAITIHTFFALVFHWKPTKSTSTWIIVAIWFCTGLLLITPNLVHRQEAYYGDTGFWCFIKSQYNTERVMTNYLWAWLSGLAMVILYPIMAVKMCCWARGTINQSLHATVARKLFLFPIVYNACVLPNSVTRWLTFTDHRVPDGVILAAQAVHTFSGFFNLILFSVTRPAMVFGKRPKTGIFRISRATHLGTSDVPPSPNSVQFVAPLPTPTFEPDTPNSHCNYKDEKDESG